MLESFSDSVTVQRSAIALALMGIPVSILPAQPAGAVASVSQMVSAQSAAATVGPVAHLSEGGAGDERPDSRRTTTTAGAGHQCTVKFQHATIGIGEGIFGVLFFEFSGCSNPSLEREPLSSSRTWRPV